MIDTTSTQPQGGHLKSHYKAWPHTRAQLDNITALGFDPAAIAAAEAAFLEEDAAHLGGVRFVREIRELFTRLLNIGGPR
ncbi:MAG: hypothetical protein HXX19_10640 [Rhodoferax sp.]|nr:hypothetical protein [Rhodoferax sp.]